MSMMNSGRLRRGRMTASMRALVRIGAAAPVAVMTMSLARERRVELVPGRRERAADRLRRPRRVRHRAADDGHVLHALRFHVQRGQLAHLAGADHQHAPASRGRRKSSAPARRPRSSPRRRPSRGPFRSARACRRANDEWNRRFRTGPTVWASAARRVRLLHLAEDLRLADDERVEAGGDAEQVARRVEIDAARRRAASALARSTPWNSLMNADELVPRGVDLVAGRVQLGAVAGREHDRLARRPAAASARSAVGERRARGSRSARAARPARSGD